MLLVKKPAIFQIQTIFENALLPFFISQVSPHGNKQTIMDISSGCLCLCLKQSNCKNICYRVFFVWIIKLKMFERKSFMNWTNLESSVGFNLDSYDSNSKLFSKIKEQSVSYFPKLIPGQFQDSCPPYHPFNMDDTINFANLDRKNLGFPQPPPRNINTGKSTEENNDSSDWAAEENLSKKGLKNLAILLLRTIRKKQFSSHREVAEEIQRKLLKNVKTVSFLKQDISKEQKNIKRRTYDALNVMIAAGVLQRQLSLVKISNHSQFMSRSYSIANKKNQHLQQLNKVTSRIERKLELLAELQSKRNALRLWKSSKQKQKHQQVTKMNFPLIFLLKDGKERVQIECESQQITIYHRNLVVYSQTDMIEHLYKYTNYFKEEQDANIIKKEETFLDEITYI